MSQAGMINTAGGPSPPDVPTQFNTDVNSPAIPIANELNVFGGYIITDNHDGIQTDGSSGSNTLTVQLTNRFQVSASFSDNATHTLFSFPMGATPGMYLFKFDLVAFNSTDSLGSAYTVEAPIRTTGAAGVKIIPPAIYQPEEGTMTQTDVFIAVNGNNFDIEVTGYLLKTITWNLTGTYTFTGAAP